MTTTPISATSSSISCPPARTRGAAAGDTYFGIEGVIGGVGNDKISGTDATDYLWGGAGSDVLDGRGGNDVLVGGAGSRDDFRFTTTLGPTNVDTIAGFEVGRDKIVLSQAIFAASSPLLDVDEFGSAPDPNNYIIYNAATGQIAYDPGGSGAGPPITFAYVAAGTALTAGDFLVLA